MKQYKFDDKNLLFTEYSAENRINPILIVLMILVGFCLYAFVQEREKQEELVIKQTTAAFSEYELRKEIRKINLPFEDIIVAQFKLETGNFQSPIFCISNNLAGMKCAKVRVYTQEGEFNGHAKYTDWKQSLQDYSLWWATYCSGIKTEEEFLALLQSMYAEDPDYINKINKLK